MRNWSDHVQAQTDANSGDITLGEMENIFNRTMKAGDEDEKRYDSAVKSYEAEDGSCRKVAGASTKITKQLVGAPNAGGRRNRSLPPPGTVWGLDQTSRRNATLRAGEDPQSAAEVA